MNEIVQNAIGLLKSAITGESVEVNRKTLRASIQILVDQGLMNMAYVGAMNCGISGESQSMRIMLDQYCIGVLHSENQRNEIQRICEALEQNGFDYMPVKGTILKEMYPNHELRPMCDADILIREEEYAGIRPVMQQLGFEEVGESDHEHIWKNTYLMVELHKRLIPSYNKDYYSFFGEGWDLAKLHTGHRWEMTQEDSFIYNFIHFAKHYRDSNVDCRFICDIFVHLRHCPDMDMAYIRRQLERLHMVEFLDHIMHVVQAWFENGPWDERTERITDVLLWQNKEQRTKDIAMSTRIAEANGSDRHVGLHRKLHRIFPPRQVMNWSYPKLAKVPLVLAWVIRWGIVLLQRPDRLKKHESVSEQQIRQYRQDLEYVGLQFSDNVALPE